MRLIPDWKDAWRWYSVRAAALGAAWVALPAEWQAFVPDQAQQAMAAALFVAVIAGRVLDQGDGA